VAVWAHALAAPDRVEISRDFASKATGWRAELPIRDSFAARTSAIEKTGGGRLLSSHASSLANADTHRKQQITFLYHSYDSNCCALDTPFEN
jgi:hypothetical protein